MWRLPTLLTHWWYLSITALLAYKALALRPQSLRWSLSSLTSPTNAAKAQQINWLGTLQQSSSNTIQTRTAWSLLMNGILSCKKLAGQTKTTLQIIEKSLSHYHSASSQSTPLLTCLVKMASSIWKSFRLIKPRASTYGRIWLTLINLLN